MRRLPILLCLALPLTAQQQFTVQQALSAPFMNQLTAAPAKARVAWFVDQEGKRNVWVASPTEAAHSITHYTEDDGQDIDDIAWSPDAEAVAYTHGTGPEGSEHPTAANPAHLQNDVQQRVEVATVRGIVKVIGEGHSPLFSADGTQLYFLRHGQAWFAKLTTAQTQAAAQAPEPTSLQEMGHPAFIKNAVYTENPAFTWYAASCNPATTCHPDRSAAQWRDLLSSRSAPTPKDSAKGVGAPHLEEMWDSNAPDNTTTEAQQLVSAHGTASQLRLSPDGIKLAFTSHRGDHSFIGIFDLKTKALTYVDPGTGLDHDAAWSPDCKHIAFIRESPVVNELDLRWMRSVPVPWSIRIADVASGQGKQVWQADAGTGSLFHEMVAKNQLLWMNDGRIVFPWEKTGWLHLYSLAPNAKQAQLLMPGDFEIDNVVTDGKRVVYSSNDVREDADGDIDRKHLSSVEVATGKVDSLTWGYGLETNPALLSNGKVVAMEASYRVPFAPALLLPRPDTLHGALLHECTKADEQVDSERCEAGSRLVSLMPQNTRTLNFVESKQVVFPANDNLQIHAQLFLPKNLKPTDKLPTIVFFHGGSRRQMLLGYNPMQYYAQTYELNQYFANHGYAVLSVNYRSGIGYGMEFRQAQHYGAFGGSEYLDIEGAVKWLKAQPWCDTHRIGAWGGSYGGYLTALALARDSADFAAGVDLHGVHDWSYELDLWRPTSDPAHDTAAAAKVAFEASPMADVGKWKSPVLLMQGDDDRNVLFGQTVRLAAALRAQGVTVEEKVYPDEVHDFLLHRDWIDAFQRATDFFDRHLKGR